ncbi:hypothetical protein DPMN_112189 [Dreissena polymorpha]|uniref:Uncharacterized protein n=1 Tax=Dreissena polymorpha TaxID=45954 RepID=A0A9D4KG14_DREPO|nr:hypothetical protein DPMN_112189 [Dreissena polymorpha]
MYLNSHGLHAFIGGPPAVVKEERRFPVVIICLENVPAARRTVCHRPHVCAVHMTVACDHTPLQQWHARKQRSPTLNPILQQQQQQQLYFYY